MFGFNFSNSSAKKEVSPLETVLNAAAQYGVSKKIETAIKERKKAEVIVDDLKGREALYKVIKQEHEDEAKALKEAREILTSMKEASLNPYSLAEEAHNLSQSKEELLGDIAEFHGLDRKARYHSILDKFDEIDNDPIV